MLHNARWGSYLMLRRYVTSTNSIITYDRSRQPGFWHLAAHARGAANILSTRAGTMFDEHSSPSVRSKEVPLFQASMPTWISIRVSIRRSESNLAKSGTEVGTAVPSRKRRTPPPQPRALDPIKGNGVFL